MIVAEVQERIGASSMAQEYSELPNELVSGANGVDYAYRDTGGGQRGALPLVLLQHFRGNLDSWDPALIDALARAPEGGDVRQRISQGNTRAQKIVSGVPIRCCGRFPGARGPTDTTRPGGGDVHWPARNTP